MRFVATNGEHVDNTIARAGDCEVERELTSISRMSELLPCVEVDPPMGVESCVIWLHGLGADGHDFAPVVPMLRTPHTRYVFPHAPLQPVTINGGYEMPAWYDIVTLDFNAPAREDMAHVETSAARVTALIARERSRGLPSHRIVLAGFSQGAAMAVHCGVRHRESLGGILVLSGYLIAASRLAAERSPANLGTPTFCGHGRFDELVPLAAGRHCHAELQRTGASGAQHTWQDYAMGHEVCPDELEHVGLWLNAVLRQS